MVIMLENMVKDESESNGCLKLTLGLEMKNVITVYFYVQVFGFARSSAVAIKRSRFTTLITQHAINYYPGRIMVYCTWPTCLGSTLPFTL